MYRLIEKTISLSYQLVRQPQVQAKEGGSDFMETESNSSNRSFIDLPKELFEMLTSVGPYLHRDTLLLQKVRNFFSRYVSLFPSLTIDICLFVFFICD